MHVDNDVFERDRLLLAPGKGEPHLDEEIALAIDPELAESPSVDEPRALVSGLTLNQAHGLQAFGLP